MPSLRDHWRAFWRSGPENVYTFIWWGILTALVAGVFAVGSWLIPRVVPTGYAIVGLAARWEDRFLSAFITVLFVTVATALTALFHRLYNSGPSPNMVHATVHVTVPREFVAVTYRWGRMFSILAILLGVAVIGVVVGEHIGVPVPLPSVLLLPAGDQMNLYNKGDTDLKLWGDKFDDTDKDIDPVARVIPKDGFYYLLIDKLHAFVLKDIGKDGSKLYPFETYPSDNSGHHHYIAKFDLLIVMKHGNMTIHTQQLGVAAEEWEH